MDTTRHIGPTLTTHQKVPEKVKPLGSVVLVPTEKGSFPYLLNLVPDCFINDRGTGTGNGLSRFLVRPSVKPNVVGVRKDFDDGTGGEQFSSTTENTVLIQLGLCPNDGFSLVIPTEHLFHPLTLFGVKGQFFSVI